MKQARRNGHAVSQEPPRHNRSPARALRVVVSRVRGSIRRFHPTIGGGHGLRIDGNLRLSSCYGARLVLGSGIRLYRDVSIVLDSSVARISIGSGTYINRRSQIFAESEVVIGENCAISWDVTIMDTDYHTINGSVRALPIHIGNGVLVGAGVTILKGVHIGDGAVVGAGAVVTRDVPGNSVAAGNPAKVVRQSISWR